MICWENIVDVAILIMITSDHLAKLFSFYWTVQRKATFTLIHQILLTLGINNISLRPEHPKGGIHYRYTVYD